MSLLLMLLLPERDRDTIVGDLMEERRAKIAEIGLIRAQCWYALQVLSFVPRAVVSSLSRHLALTGLCLFTALCGTWLGAMDLRFRHPGYVSQTGIALLIVGQAALTLWTLVLPARIFRMITMAGTCGMIWLACKAFYGVTHDPHFEGYIVLIALMLVIQSILTWLAMLRDRRVFHSA